MMEVRLVFFPVCKLLACHMHENMRMFCLQNTVEAVIEFAFEYGKQDGSTMMCFF